MLQRILWFGGRPSGIVKRLPGHYTVSSLTGSADQSGDDAPGPVGHRADVDARDRSSRPTSTLITTQNWTPSLSVTFPAPLVENFIGVVFLLTCS